MFNFRQISSPFALWAYSRPSANEGGVQHNPLNTFARANGLNPSGETSATINSPLSESRINLPLAQMRTIDDVLPSTYRVREHLYILIYDGRRSMSI